MNKVTYKQANFRYKAVFFPMMAIYTIFCIGGALLLTRLDTPPNWLPHIVAIFTVAPIFVVFWLIWRYVQETDEYTRLRQLQALAIGGMITASAAGTIGFLQLYNAIPVGSVPTFLLLPLFFLSYGLAKWLRGEEGCV